jgi:hypothetical protein
MDLSKLPRLSKTETPPPSTDAPTGDAAQTPASPPPASAARPCPECQAPLRAGARFCDSCGMPVRSRSGPEAGGGPEAWISVALGVILLFMFPNFVKYAMHPHNTTAIDAVDMQTGASIPYATSALIWPDLGVTLFAVVLLVEGALMLLTPSRLLTAVCLALSACAAAFNIWVIARSYPVIGFQIVCSLAVAFCIYICLYQWKVFQGLRAPQ